MAAEVSLTVSDEVTAEQQARLDDLLDNHNIETTGIRDARLLSIEARSADGEFQGGIHGYTWGGYCEIKTIFVAEGQRGQGLGRRMMEAAEAEARSRHCRRIVLSTHGFQAPAFYERLGFSCVGRIDDCPVGDSFLLMVKQLG